MGPLVVVQIGFLGERLLADIALEGTLAGVDTFVVAQVDPLTERLLAHVAGNGLTPVCILSWLCRLAF